MQIKYLRGDFKYLNTETVWYQSSIFPEKNIRTTYYTILRDGMCAVRKGYVNDGASFICIDTDTVRPGAMFHDMFYEALRKGQLEPKWREQADNELKIICLSDGMCRPRAWLIHTGVRLGAGPMAHPRRRRKVFTAGVPTKEQEEADKCLGQ